MSIISTTSISLSENYIAQAIDLKKRLVELQKNMYSFGLMLTSDQEQANDLMQETNLKVLKNLDKYRNNVNFKGWVFIIMRNIFINNYRRTKYESTETDISDNLILLNSSQNSGLITPSEHCNMLEINFILDGFDDTYKVPFSMYLSGYKYQEIADEMSLPIGTIKSRIFSVRKQLRILLTDYI